MKPPEEKFYRMYEAPPEKLGLIRRYIKAIPYQGIVVLDNNVIPYTDKKHLRSIPKENLDEIIKYNEALKESIQNFGPERVIIAKEIREEMNQSIDFVIHKIKDISCNVSLHSKLIKSYEDILAQAKSKKRLEHTCEVDDNIIYFALKNIVRKLVLDFPELKKEPSSGDEPDEHMIAYAFAEAIAQDKKLFIMSSDKDVLNIAGELYAVLTTKNVVGIDTIAGRRLSLNNVEVVCFDSRKNLFKPAYNGKEDALTEWKPRNGYSSQDKAEFIKFVQENLVDVEASLGNGAALAAIIKKKESVLVPEEDCPAAEEPDPEADVLMALERIYARIGIDPEKLNVDDQDKIADAIDVCRDFKVVYKKSGISTASLDEEIKQLQNKTLGKLIKATEQELTSINEQIVSLRQDPKYLRARPSDSIIQEETQLIKDFAEKQKELFSYEKKAKPDFVDSDDFTEQQQNFLDALQELGVKEDSSGLWASNTDIAKALGWQQIKVSRQLRKLEADDKVERKQGGRLKLNRINSTVVKELLPEQKP